MTALDFGSARPARADRAKGLDSNQDPDPGQVATAGYTFVSYYLTGPGSMTAAKVAACAAHGVAVIANFEQLANPTGRGYSGGRSDAQTALAAANACGIPGDRPIYFSLDYDVQPSGFAAVDAYLDGIASVLSPSRIGVYSSTWCIDHLAGNGKATWFWQSMSGGFSGGQNATLNPHTHIWQRGYATVGGASCDWDYVITADYGQWGTPGPHSAFPSWDSSWSVFNPVSNATTVFGRGLDGKIGFSRNSGSGWSQWAEVNNNWRFAGDPRAVYHAATHT
ncbi:glycoside hydrolase domain-containing protein, partial [Nonomuraea sp. NPDC050536]|uniref:glycoside hydrolase domain-containing protein n=1 Tax=Nonomuraea sp. NPDC050536 TaxID=3364366 RepID=UPI0037CA17A1